MNIQFEKLFTPEELELAEDILNNAEEIEAELVGLVSEIFHDE